LDINPQRLGGGLRRTITKRHASVSLIPKHGNAAQAWRDLLEELQTLGREFVTQNEMPEEDSKVVATAKSVWHYITEGRCRAPRKGAHYAMPTDAEVAKLRDVGEGYASALALFLELKRAHGARALRGETFAIVCESMAEQEVVPGWRDKKRYMKARDLLLGSGLITCVRTSQRLKYRAEGKWCYGNTRAAEYTFGGAANVNR
jgi:hypothetical protein